MTWEEIMRRVLPPNGVVQPHVTGPGAFGAGEKEGRKPPSSIPHKGVDFNYIGGQSPLNKSYPELHSPVAGVVTSVGGKYGIIAIRDANGFSHEILHTHTQSVKVGDLVDAGTPIGTMGNTGVNQKHPEEGQYHVHYQLKNSAGNFVNPTAFWDQPPFLDESKRAAQIISGGDVYVNPSASPPDRPGGPFYSPFGRPFSPPAATAPPAAPDRSDSFDDRFGKWGSAPAARIAPPAVSDAPASFDDRFGNWASSPAGISGNAGSPVLRALEQMRRSETPGGVTPTSAPVSPSAWPFLSADASLVGGALGKYFDTSPKPDAASAQAARPSLSNPGAPPFPADEAESGDVAPVRKLGRRVVNLSSAPASAGAPPLAGDPQDSFDDRFGSWTTSAVGAAPRAPNRVPSSPVLGVFSGKPMRDFPVPPPIWGMEDKSSTAGDNDLFRRWMPWIDAQ